MFRTQKILIGAVLWGAIAFVGTANAGHPEAQTRMEDEFTISLEEGANLDHILRKYHLIPVESFGPYRRVRIKDMDRPNVSLRDLERHPDVAWAEYTRRQQTPESVRQMVVAVVGASIEEYRGQKVYQHLDLELIHAVTRGEGVTVAVIDTGVNAEHSALKGRVLPNGIDFVGHDRDPQDEANGVDDDGDGEVDEAAGHGTLVAGTILLTAPECNLLPVRVMDDEGNGTAFSVARGIFYAISQEVDVINLSLGLPEYSQIIEDAILAAHNAGIIVVAAAGNMGNEFPPYYPASSAYTLSVASVSASDVKSDFSNYHQSVTVSAPGENILGPFWNGGWAIGDGTSFATPFIAGQAALILSSRPSAPKNEAEGVVKQGTIDVDDVQGNQKYRGKLGQGRFDAKRTLELIEPLVSASPELVDVALFFAHPNPSAVGEAVRFDLQTDGIVSTERLAREVEVFDVSGRTLATLRASDESSLVWDGRDDRGRLAPAGTYFLRLRSEAGETVAGFRIVKLANR